MSEIVRKKECHEVCSLHACAMLRGGMDVQQIQKTYWQRWRTKQLEQEVEQPLEQQQQLSLISSSSWGRI